MPISARRSGRHSRSRARSINSPRPTSCTLPALPRRNHASISPFSKQRTAPGSAPMRMASIMINRCDDSISTRSVVPRVPASQRDRSGASPSVCCKWRTACTPTPSSPCRVFPMPMIRVRGNVAASAAARSLASLVGPGLAICKPPPRRAVPSPSTTLEPSLSPGRRGGLDRDQIHAASAACRHPGSLTVSGRRRPPSGVRVPPQAPRPAVHPAHRGPAPTRRHRPDRHARSSR